MNVLRGQKTQIAVTDAALISIELLFAFNLESSLAIFSHYFFFNL